MNMYTYHIYANDSLSGPTLHNRTVQTSELNQWVWSLEKNHVDIYSDFYYSSSRPFLSHIVLLTALFLINDCFH